MASWREWWRPSCVGVDIFLAALHLRVFLGYDAVAFAPPSRRLTGKVSPRARIKEARHALTGDGCNSGGSEQSYNPNRDDGACACDVRISPLRDAIVTRRASIASAATLAAASIFPTHPAYATSASEFTPAIQSLTIPLEYQPNLSAYTISYNVGTTTFGAIIDTGSPFLLVPHPSEAACSPSYKWGCFRPEESQASGLGPTLERFDGNEGWVEWREGRFMFDTTTNGEGVAMTNESVSSTTLSNVPAANAAGLEGDAAVSSPTDAMQALFPRSLMTFGVISESLMDGPGGIFLGLVKNTDGRIRPSFLGQSDVSAFAVDLRDNGRAKALTLYGGSTTTTDDRQNFDGRLDPSNAIHLVRDLNKRFGDPTVHYVGVAKSITVNGSTLAASKRGSKIYCILDTGCSGLSVSPSLFDERYATARANREKSLWGAVDVELQTVSGDTVKLSAEKPIVTPLGSERPWGKKLDGHLVVVGLASLEGKRMTVDIDGERAWFED